MATGSAFAATFDLKSRPLADLLWLVYGEELKLQFVLDDQLIDRRVTFQYRNARPEQARIAVENYLKTIGVHTVERNGVIYFSSSTAPDKKSDSTTTVGETPDAQTESDSTEAEDVALDYFTGPSIDGIEKNLELLHVQCTRVLDKYLLSGRKADVERAKEVLQRISDSSRILDVRVLIVEYSSDGSDNRGFSAALNVLNGKLGISIGAPSGITSSSAAIKITTGSFEAILGILDSTSDFRLLQDARLRVRTGGKGKIAVGKQVPTLGQTTLDNQNRQMNSIVYQQAGLTVEVSPSVEGESVKSDVTVSLSDFQANSTSGIDSPIKSERVVNSQLETKIGEVTCIGGLQSENGSHNTLELWGIPLNSQRSSSQSTILVFLGFEQPGQPG